MPLAALDPNRQQRRLGVPRELAHLTPTGPSLRLPQRKLVPPQAVPLKEDDVVAPLAVGARDALLRRGDDGSRRLPGERVLEAVRRLAGTAEDADTGEDPKRAAFVGRRGGGGRGRGGKGLEARDGEEGRVATPRKPREAIVGGGRKLGLGRGRGGGDGRGALSDRAVELRGLFAPADIYGRI